MSDTEFLLRLLRAGPQTRVSVIAACSAARRPGMVVNSRVSELRARGHDITCERITVPKSFRDVYVYTLHQAQEAAA